MGVVIVVPAMNQLTIARSAHWVILTCKQFDRESLVQLNWWVSLGVGGFHWALVCFIGRWWVSLGVGMFNWALVGLIGRWWV